MSTHDYVIANQNGANTRSDLNNAFSAIVSNNSSATEPTTTYAFMWWADTANDLLKQRNAADSAWINILTLSTGVPSGGFKNDGTENLTSLGIDDNATSTAVTLDSSGNVLVGKTTISGAFNTVGTELRATGLVQSTVDGNKCIDLNRKTSDGNFIGFSKDGSAVGTISAHDGYLTIGQTFTGLQFIDSGNKIIPRDPTNGTNRDNIIDLGDGANRFDDIYATNGTIQTSDRNEKQDIEELSEAEQRVAIACKGLMRKFRWKDKVAEKGDDARIHFGIIAQDLQDAFTAEGLDAGRYAMFISTTWYEKQTPVDAVEAVEATYDDEGNELTEAVEAKDAYIRTDTEDEPTEGYTERTRLGVRYPELLAFIISAI